MAKRKIWKVLQSTSRDSTLSIFDYFNTFEYLCEYTIIMYIVQRSVVRRRITKRHDRELRCVLFIYIPEVYKMLFIDQRKWMCLIFCSVFNSCYIDCPAIIICEYCPCLDKRDIYLSLFWVKYGYLFADSEAKEAKKGTFVIYIWSYCKKREKT